MPPTKLHDRTPLPDHPYSKDCRIGWVAPDFDFEEIDMMFSDKSVKFLENHAKESPGKPFFLFHSTQGVHLPSFPGKDFLGKTNAGPHGDFIFEFDHVVGELLNTLDRLGMAENTIVMVRPASARAEASSTTMAAGGWGSLKLKRWRQGEDRQSLRLRPQTNPARHPCLEYRNPKSS